MALGDQMQSLNVRQSLQYHVTYHLFYSIDPNGTKKKIKMHLLGILNHNNVSLDLLQRHDYI